MDLTLFFALLGGLLVLAFVANRLVRFTRVPDVIILMATGVLIGPVLHWVNPDTSNSPHSRRSRLAHAFGGKLFIVFCMNLSTFSCRLFTNFLGS